MIYQKNQNQTKTIKVLKKQIFIIWSEKTNLATLIVPVVSPAQQLTDRPPAIKARSSQEDHCLIYVSLNLKTPAAIRNQDMPSLSLPVSANFSNLFNFRQS